jgi:phage-related protein (TIGR01555 family)
MRFMDGLRNVVSGIGTAKDKTTANQFWIRPLSQYDVESAYIEDGFSRKIVDRIPADMTREWRIWEAKDAEALYEAERILQVRQHFELAETWARLYGGSAILIGDGSPDPRLPFDPATIQKGGLKYLQVFSRWELNAVSFEQNIMSPDFGKPSTYMVSAPGSIREIEVHRSRFAIFDGMAAPRIFRQANSGWGLSVLQAIRTAIFNVAASTANAAALTEEAKTDIITFPNLDDMLSTPDGEARLTSRFALAMQLKSTLNTLVLGNGEVFDRKQISFAGLPELIRAHIEIAAGVADMPVTLLLGTSPGGLNATGDSDTRNYYDNIRAKQHSRQSSSMWALDEALIRHVIGDRPKDVTYSWVSLWQPSPKESADVALVKAQTTAIYIASNLFTQDELRNSVADQLIADGVYPTLDQHMTETAAGTELMGADPLLAAPDDPNADPTLPVDPNAEPAPAIP